MDYSVLGDMMKSILLATTFLLAAAGSALAADAVSIEVAPEMAPAGFVWTGGYVGLQAGYLWGSTSVAFPEVPVLYSNPDPDGFIGGVYAGYNHQFDNGFIAGIEGDFALSNADGDDLIWDDIGSFPAETWTSSIDWTAAIRARAGYAIDQRTMVYAAGGVAFAGTEATVSDLGVVREKISDTLVGWTVGVGGEHALTDNLIARAEYRYSDFGSNSHTGLPSGMLDTDLEYQTHDVRLGLAYKF